jgi:hypothetical protein
MGASALPDIVLRVRFIALCRRRSPLAARRSPTAAAARLFTLLLVPPQKPKTTKIK